MPRRDSISDASLQDVLFSLLLSLVDSIYYVALLAPSSLSTDVRFVFHRFFVAEYHL